MKRSIKFVKLLVRYSYYLTVAIFIAVIIGLAATNRIASDTRNIYPPLPVPTGEPASDESVQEMVRGKQHLHDKEIQTKTIDKPEGKAVLISEKPITAADLTKMEQLAKTTTTHASPFDLKFINSTGAYPTYESELKQYFNKNLLWTSTELSQLKEIELVDCASCNWLGLYQGTYTMNSQGKIVSAFGWMTLNVNMVKNSGFLLDYMKLTLAHEYGHHYSLYYKWTKLNLPQGTRFPDEYYQLRGLSKDTTAPDYSKGWMNSDAEIVAEDYSYFFSSYKMHAMAGTYGYPNDNIKSWFVSLTTGAIAQDSEPPVVTILSPQVGKEYSGNMEINIDATDNRVVRKVEVSINNQLATTFTGGPYKMTIDSTKLPNGDNVLRVTAYDDYQSTARQIIFTVNNNVVAPPPLELDTVPPVITITSPEGDPHNWTTGNLRLSATATDNQLVAKMEIFINGVFVASQNGNNIEAIWRTFKGEGIFEVKFIATDSSGNKAERIITVYKQ